MTIFAVACLSAATLAFEVLLVRLFAIEQFYHFAYMAIGVAMLGFGASGTIVTLLPRELSARLQAWFAPAAITTAAALLITPIVAERVPFDVTLIALDSGQWLNLAILYALLALPFGAGAMAVLIAIIGRAERPGRVYGASFVGSGLGAAFAVAVLWIVTPAQALALAALVAAVGALASTVDRETHRLWRFTGLTTAFLSVATLDTPWSPSVTPYKGLPQVEAYPNAERVSEDVSPVGWLVAVRAPAFRHAPGLSLSYEGSFPTQTAAFVDGHLAGTITEWPDEGTAREILAWIPAAIPHAVGERRRVLVLGAGGGFDVWAALHHGASEISAVDLHPGLVALQRHSFAAATNSYAGQSVLWHAGDARNYVGRTSDPYDLIVIGPEGGFGTSVGGVSSLSEDFLHTTDAYVSYLKRLSEDGMLAVTRWFAVPPRANVRVILTAVRALRAVAPANASRGLVVVRSWGTVTTLVKPAGFSEPELRELEAWTTPRRFDIDWMPGASVPTAQFNRMAEPTLYQAASEAIDDRESEFVEQYPFVVAPVSDSRPYPHHFLDLRAVRNLVTTERGGWLPFAEWGYLAFAATLIQAVAVAGVLMIVPVAIRARSALTPRLTPVLIYFGAIGFAYLAAEIAAMQQLGLLLGHPVYAVAAVLAIMLVCSGIGSTWSDRLPIGRARSVPIALAVVLALYGVGLLALVHAAHAAGFGVRLLVGGVVLVPAALLMGMPFPIGLRQLALGDRNRIAWAWAMNGFASVVAAPLAALLSLEAGTRVLFVAAAASYVLAWAATRRYSPEQR